MTYSYAPDIEESILTALQTIFTTELMGLSGDSLSLNVLKEAPLQDDPTQVAPYLVYSPDRAKGFRIMTREECTLYGDSEIGGPLRVLRFFTATCGVPFYSTRNATYAAINNLTWRVYRVLIKYFDLAGVNSYGPLMSPDQTEVIEGANPYHMFEGASTTLEGGEQTWFGTGHLAWKYPISTSQQYRVFTGSSLAH